MRCGGRCSVCCWSCDHGDGPGSSRTGRWRQRKAAHASGLVQRILDADTAQVPGIIGRWPRIASGPIRCCVKLTKRWRRNPGRNFTPALPCCRWIALRSITSPAGCSTPNRTKCRSFVTPWPRTRTNCWTGYGPWLTPEKGKEAQRLRAAAALARYDPESEKWKKAKPNRRQRPRAGKPGLPGSVERDIPAREKLVTRSAGCHFS